MKSFIVASKCDLFFFDFLQKYVFFVFLLNMFHYFFNIQIIPSLSYPLSQLESKHL